MFTQSEIKDCNTHTKEKNMKNVERVEQKVSSLTNTETKMLTQKQLKDEIQNLKDRREQSQLYVEDDGPEDRVNDAVWALLTSSRWQEWLDDGHVNEFLETNHTKITYNDYANLHQQIIWDRCDNLDYLHEIYHAAMRWYVRKCFIRGVQGEEELNYYTGFAASIAV